MSASASGGSSRRPVGEAIEMGIARHRLDQRAEAGTVALRARPVPSRKCAGSRVSGLMACSASGPKPHFSSVPGTKFSTSTWALGDQRAGRRRGLVLADVERDRALVARIDLPEGLDAVGAPVPQVVALLRMLDLDDVGAVIGEQQRAMLPATSRDRSSTRTPSSGPALVGIEVSCRRHRRLTPAR